MMDRKVW